MSGQHELNSQRLVLATSLMVVEQQTMHPDAAWQAHTMHSCCALTHSQGCLLDWCACLGMAKDGQMAYQVLLQGHRAEGEFLDSCLLPLRRHTALQKAVDQQRRLA